MLISMLIGSVVALVQFAEKSFETYESVKLRTIWGLTGAGKTTLISQLEHVLVSEAKSSHTFARATNFKRKALKLVVKGKMCFARPDTGSDRNIMTAAFAKEHNIHILQNEEDQDTFMMGNGQYTKSIGKALVPCKLLGTMSTESLWFHVMAKCSAPLIMGLEYLSKIKLYTENKHLLVDCPFFFGKFPRFKWIGAPKGMVQFSADGHQLTAGVDTGSDLDLMSLRCALRNGFNIDRSRRTQVMLADERIVETIGEVDISSIQLPGFDDFSMSFHVLPNLVCDVIFGEEFLEQTDTFNAFDIVDEEHDWDLYSLNIFVNLGRVQALFSAVTGLGGRRRRRIKKYLDGMNDGVVDRAEHSAQLEEEMYHQHQAERLIAKMKDRQKAAVATGKEAERRRKFENKHVGCAHCIDGQGGSISGARGVDLHGGRTT